MTENNFCISVQEVTKTVDTPDGALDILQNISLNSPIQEADNTPFTLLQVFKLILVTPFLFPMKKILV